MYYFIYILNLLYIINIIIINNVYFIIWASLTVINNLS